MLKMNNKDSESSSYSYSKHPRNRNFTPVNTTTIGRVLPLVSVLEDNSNQTLRDTELSIKSGFKSVKNLTHPSDLKKRIRAAKQSLKCFQDDSEGGTMETPPKKRRKLEDTQQWGVFHHLATLRRKQKCLMERDSQAVPTSPQVDPAPSDFLSLHSAQTSKETLNDKPIAKRVLFTSDQSLHLHEVSPSSGFCLDCESSLSSSSSSSSFDNHHQGQPSIFPRGRTLETPHREVAGLESSETNSHDVPSLFEDQPTQFAQVPLLQSNSYFLLRPPHLTSPPPPAEGSTAVQYVPNQRIRESCEESGSNQDDTSQDSSILHLFPREE